MQSAGAATFDEAYYQHYYFDKKTKVVDPRHVERLGAFVCAYLRYLRVPVRRVLDVGCGIGLWRDVVARQFPSASYHGVEFSEYLCGRYGWERGSVTDYQARTPFDFVICQGVLPYLSPPDLKRALRNLGGLSQGALYVEAVTREDYERGGPDRPSYLSPQRRAVPSRAVSEFSGGGRRRVAEPAGRAAIVLAGVRSRVTPPK